MFIDWCLIITAFSFSESTGRAQMGGGVQHPLHVVQVGSFVLILVILKCKNVFISAELVRSCVWVGFWISSYTNVYSSIS